jgi:hypothetical protein
MVMISWLRYIITQVNKPMVLTGPEILIVQQENKLDFGKNDPTVQ